MYNSAQCIIVINTTCVALCFDKPFFLNENEQPHFNIYITVYCIYSFDSNEIL